MTAAQRSPIAAAEVVVAEVSSHGGDGDGDGDGDLDGRDAGDGSSSVH